MLLIERAASLRTHAGQVAFPGGASDPDDADAVATALREAHEEVGLEPAHVHVAGRAAGDLPAADRFVVTPVLGWFDRSPHPAERGRRRRGRRASRWCRSPSSPTRPTGSGSCIRPAGTGPGFEVGGAVRLGLHRGPARPLFALGGWARPWDEHVFRPLPAG